MTDIKKYQLSVEAGEKAYNDTEGNLEYAIEVALKHHDRAFADTLAGEEMVEKFEKWYARINAPVKGYVRPMRSEKEVTFAAWRAALAVVIKEIGR